MQTTRITFQIGVDCLGFPIYHTHEIVFEEVKPLIEYPEIKNRRKPLDIINHRKYKLELKSKKP